MLSLRKFRYIFFASALAILVGCNEENPSAKDDNPPVKKVRVKVGTDQEYLGNRIKIPKPAYRVKYEIRALGIQSRFPGPTDYRLTALLYYSDADFEELTKSNREKLARLKQKKLIKIEQNGEESVGQRRLRIMRERRNRYSRIVVPKWIGEEDSFKEQMEGGYLRLEHFTPLDLEDYYRSPYLHGEVKALDKQRAILVILYTM